MTSEHRRTPSGGYAQDWSAYNAAQTNEKRHFLLLLKELCQVIDEPEQIIGRPRLALRDMIFCAAFKVYSTISARHFATDLHEAQAKGLIGKVPHFNSISHYFQLESLTPILTQLIETSSLPLKPFENNIAVDATGLSTCRYARWLDEREMRERSKRNWIKVHLVCGVRTNIVMSVVVTSQRSNDSPHFGRLVTTAARNFKVEEVTADKGYLGAENMRQALINGIMPYIPFKSNCLPGAEYKGTFWENMLQMYRFRQHEFMEHYNRRNNVETTFSMLKAKFGDRLRSKGTQAQFNEALCKVLCHNLCVIIQSMYEFGVVPEFSVNNVSLMRNSEVVDRAIGGGRILAGSTRVINKHEDEKQPGKRSRKRDQRFKPDQLNLFEGMHNQ